MPLFKGDGEKWMRKIVFEMTAGFAGMNEMRLFVFDNNPTDLELNDIAQGFAEELAAMYGVEPYPEGDEDDENTLYSDNIEGWWVEYSEDEHSHLDEDEERL
jgi:hypothetical protein